MANGHHTSRLHISNIIAPYDFEAALTQYNIYPWVREGETLVRTLCLKSGEIAKSEIQFVGTTENPQLVIDVKSCRTLASEDLSDVQEIIGWCLRLDFDPHPFVALCKRDPVLQAALGNYKGGRGKIYPTVWEAIIGAICAQNTVFTRLYGMMHNIAFAFGPSLEINEDVYYAFPTPLDIASASEEALRECKVGYRAKSIKRIAQALVERNLDLESLKDLTNDEACSQLLVLPGIGPYTANLVLSVGLGRNNVLHLDSFVREIMHTFYFQGEKVSDQTIMHYAQTHWAGFESMAIGLLTTDTHLWAKALGVEFRLKSGAR